MRNVEKLIGRQRDEIHALVTRTATPQRPQREPSFKSTLQDHRCSRRPACSPQGSRFLCASLSKTASHRRAKWPDLGRSAAAPKMPQKERKCEDASRFDSTQI